jgi:hypothetical protein
MTARGSACQGLYQALLMTLRTKVKVHIDQRCGSGTLLLMMRHCSMIVPSGPTANDSCRQIVMISEINRCKIIFIILITIAFVGVVVRHRCRMLCVYSDKGC